MVSEVIFEKEENAPWGFRLTGGPQFNMPITVFEVEEGGRAFKAGIRCGDVLVRINGMDAGALSLEDAHKMIGEAGNNISLSISNDDQELLEDEELAKAQALSLLEEDTDTEISQELLKSNDSIDDLSTTQKSEQSQSDIKETESAADAPNSISKNSVDEESDSSMASNKAALSNKMIDEYDDEEERIDVNSLPLKPPMPAPVPEKPQRKCWHPVMLDTNPPPIIEESTGSAEYPHKKTIRNLRKAIDENKQGTKQKRQQIPSNCNMPVKEEAVPVQLRSMQRQLERLSRLPATIQATLAAVSNKIQVLLPEQTDADSDYDYGENDDEATDQTNDTDEIYIEDITEVTEPSDDILEEESDFEGIGRPVSQSETDPMSTPVPPTPSPTPEEEEKFAKMQKLETLNRSWPWADESRPVYKIAEHYEPVYAKCIGRKVKWLEEKISSEQIYLRRLRESKRV